MFGVLTACIVGLTLATVALATPPIDPPPSSPQPPAIAPPAVSPPAPGPSLAAFGLSWLLILLTFLAPLSLFILWKRDVIRPGSFTRHGVRPTETGWTPALLLAALFVFILSALGAAAVFSAIAAPDGSRTIRGDAIVSISGHILGISAALGAFAYVHTVARIPPPRIARRDVGLGLVCLAFTLPVTLAASQLASLLRSLLTDAESNAIGHSTLATLTQNRHDPWAWVLVGSAVLLAPILEELLYRGLVQSGLLAATRSAWLSICCTTAVFTLLHVDAVPSWTALVPIAVLSIAMGIAFERTKSIGVPIVMHIGFNAINTAMAVLLTGGR